MEEIKFNSSVGYHNSKIKWYYLFLLSGLLLMFVPVLFKKVLANEFSDIHAVISIFVLNMPTLFCFLFHDRKSIIKFTIINNTGIFFYSKKNEIITEINTVSIKSVVIKKRTRSTGVLRTPIKVTYQEIEIISNESKFRFGGSFTRSISSSFYNNFLQFLKENSHIKVKHETIR